VKAGGLKEDASDEMIVIRGAALPEASPESSSNMVQKVSDASVSPALLAANNKNIIPIDLRKLVDEGHLELNVSVRGGDIVTVRSSAQHFIYVLGYVQHPSSFELKAPQVDALQAVAMAGGLGPAARAENSFMVRQTPDGQSVVPLDLNKMAAGTVPPVSMQAGDTLVVGSGFWARLAEFVRPSVSMGGSYSPVP
jgi:protein involved in polysaccharide export with SLBB domain